MHTFSNATKTSRDAVAWKALKNVSERFSFENEEILALMGDMPLSSYYKGINKQEGRLSRDDKTRISLLLGIYKNLRILFVDSNQAMSWINRNNSLPPFNGLTPRAYILEGSLMRLVEVRRFLDFWRG